MKKIPDRNGKPAHPVYIASAAGIILYLLFIVIQGNENGKYIATEITEEAIVVSDQSDPFYGLAQKIAQSENLKIVHNVPESLQFTPGFIILVASPEYIDEENLFCIGRIFKDLQYYPALGIISGSTIGEAEELWMRRRPEEKGGYYLAGDREKGHSFDSPVILNLDETTNESCDLNRENLSTMLTRASYLYWARHVTGDNWFWNTASKDFGKNDRFYTKDIPELHSTVIYTPSCASFRPWTNDSIALGFTNRGAAAYIGHVFSPISNAFLMRRGSLIPGMYASWKDFPLGITAQIQNRMTAKTAFTTPLFFMLGDPRIYLSDEQPYQITSDTIDERNRRRIVGSSDNRGILAAKIENGAEYKFIRIPGTGVSGEKDVFYNNNIQSIDLGMDKYLLFFHRPGEFQFELREKEPILYRLFDPLLDAFDYSWITVGPAYSPLAVLLFIILSTVLLFKKIRLNESMMGYRKVFLYSIAFACIRLLYLLIRMKAYSVNAVIVEFTVPKIILGVTGMFSSTAAGLIIMQDSRRAVVKAIGLILAVLPQVALTGFYLFRITFINILIRTESTITQTIWNYNSFWLPFIVLAVESMVVLIIRHRINR